MKDQRVAKLKPSFPLLRPAPPLLVHPAASSGVHPGPLPCLPLHLQSETLVLSASSASLESVQLPLPPPPQSHTSFAREMPNSVLVNVSASSPLHNPFLQTAEGPKYKANHDRSPFEILKCLRHYCKIKGKLLKKAVRHP